MPPRLAQKPVTQAILAEACRRSFYLFAQLAFGIKFHNHARPDDAWFDPAVHGQLCDWLQYHAEDWLKIRTTRREPKKLLICIPRGYGKSTLVTCAFTCWLHLRDPELVTAISSYDEPKSMDFLRVIENTLEGTSGYGWWRHLYGSWRPTDDRPWRREAATHAGRKNLAMRDPSFFISSVTTGITGARPDMFILDDPIVEEKLVRETNWIEKAKNHVDSVRFAIKTNGLWVVSLTRYRDDDVAAKLLMEEGVRHWAETGMTLEEDEFVPKGPWEVFFMSARDAQGLPTLPHIWTEERLAEAEKIDPIGFAAQMMNKPAEGGHMPIRKEHIQRMWVNPRDVPSDLAISIHCDTAFKEPDKIGHGDYNVIQVWGHSRDGTGHVYYLMGKRSNEWSGEDFARELVGTLKQLKREGLWPFVVTDEKVGNKDTAFEGQMLGIAREAGMTLPPILWIPRRGRTPEIRIREVVAAWTTGRVKLVRDAPEVRWLVSEMLKIGVSAHDDMAVAASDVFHPEVYIPAGSATNVQPPAPIRPFDVLMWTPQGEWTNDEVRAVYDETEWREHEEESGQY